MLKLQWSVATRRVCDLIVWDKNPRKMSSKDRQDLHASFNRFDYVEIIVIDLDNRIIGGHQRHHELMTTGHADEIIDVRVPNRKLTDVEFDELAIRLNKNRGQWDEDKLAELFSAFDLKDWGFEEQLLNNLFDDLNEVTDDQFNLEEELAKIDIPVTQSGDLYRLGDHLLYCGDCTDESVKTVFHKADKARVIYCDPPYNIGLSYHKGIKGNSNKKTYTNRVFNDNMKPDAYLQWLCKTIEAAKQLAKPDVHVFYWCDPKFIGIVQRAFEQTKVKNKSVCFWIKNQFNPVIQMAFNRVTEPCIYGTIGRPGLNHNITNLCEIMNKEVEGRKIHDSVFEMADIWLAHRDNTTDYVHPTQKPVTLHEKPLKRCSAPGDTVVDLFGGSGSTIISCEQLKRKAVVTEQDPVFCDVIVRRWERLTGQKAEVIKREEVWEST